MAEGKSASGRQASRVDWIRFRVTTVTLRSCQMEWEIGGGGEARVVVGRSCAREGENNWETKEGSRGKDEESWRVLTDEVKSAGYPTSRMHN